MFNSKYIVQLYNDSIQIKKTCLEQRYAFNYWLSHNKNAPGQSMAFDTETTGLSFGVPTILQIGKTDIRVPNIKSFGISMTIPTKTKLILLWGRIGTVLYDDMIKLLNMNGQKVAHNARYDMRVCDINNIKIKPNIHCSLTASRIYWDRRQKFGLQPLSEMIVPELSDWENEVKKAWRNLKAQYTRKGYSKTYTNYSFIPDDLMSVYSMTDTFMTFIVHQITHPHMIKTFDEVYTREIKVMHLALKMEHLGMQYDRRESSKQERLLTKQASKFEQKLYKLAKGEFNIKSPAQLLKILLKLGVEKYQLTKDGKLSTDKTLLEPILDNKSSNKKALKFIETLLNIKAIYKILYSYLIPLRERSSYNNGRLYCNINAADTVTGRMAVTSPGLQTIPRVTSKRKRKSPIRSCFICRTGYIHYHFDYAQIEMIFYAALIGEHRIVDAYNRGEDIYTVIAEFACSKEDLDYIRDTLGEPRQQLKHLSLAVLYGAGVPGTAKILQMNNKQAEKLLNGYLEACPLVTDYREKCKRELYSKGYVEDLFGRRYHIEPGQAYKAPNAVVQGGCAQVLKEAIIQVDEYLNSSGEQARILIPVHDEIILERPASDEHTEQKFIKKIKRAMSDITQLTSRGMFLRVDVKKTKTNWASKQKME